MELIPILSTIILVATISTFILAIGAYVLYKVRERRGTQQTVQTQTTVQAEVLSPITAPVQQPVYVEPRKGQQPMQSVHTPKPKEYPGPEQQQAPEQRVSSDGKILRYTSEGYVSTKEDKRGGEIKWR
ncbi:MAG: hypothetical protein HXY49_09310 [Ignavibacteriaceae bacterium]|nr:hypothetical protein [Ignavibacteriaceae bacterium]